MRVTRFQQPTNGLFGGLDYNEKLRSKQDNILWLSIRRGVLMSISNTPHQSQLAKIEIVLKLH
jgi:hypothetical protein